MPCEICGYEEITEKHHPHQRETMDIVIELDIIRLPEIGEKTTMVADVYKHPMATVTLCPNCHILFSRKNHDLNTVVKIQEKYFKSINPNIELCTSYIHIQKIKGVYCFIFNKDELKMPKDITPYCKNIRENRQKLNQKLKELGW